MKFYDLNVRGQNFDNDLKLIKEASKFGWNHINLNYSPDYYKKAQDYHNELSQEVTADISMGINIVGAKNQNEARKIANKFRSKSNYISCLGGDLKLNRAICENIKMDVLSRPYYKRHDSGMNHVLAKLAAKNNVAIELCFRDILNQHLKYRANAIASFKEILKFHRKFNFPIILTTDTKYIYDVRTTRDIVAVFKSIGFTNEEIYKGFYQYPKEILNFNKQRKNMIVQGVKVIEGASNFTEVHKKEETDVDFDNLFTDDIEYDGEYEDIEYDGEYDDIEADEENIEFEDINEEVI